MPRQPIEVPLQTMDAATGEPRESDGRMFLMPAKEGTCEICATAHESDQPHNAQSLFYQMRFQLEHGRGADWRDAMSHCSDEIRALWTEQLNLRGVDVEAGQVNPAPKEKRRG
jgi:hypothetical protein